MQQLILILHVLVSVSLIGLVLIQHGKGADVGATFGSGASNTMFGSAGSTPFLVKVTGTLAAIFFMTSLGLSYMVSKRVQPAASVAAPIERQLPATSMPGSESKKAAPESPETPD